MSINSSTLFPSSLLRTTPVTPPLRSSASGLAAQPAVSSLGATAPPQGNLLQLVSSMLDTMQLMVQTFSTPSTAQPTPPQVGPVRQTASGVIPAGRPDLAQVYLRSIDQQGNINHALLDNYQNMGPVAAKVNMYEQYLKEFLLVKRDYQGANQYAATPVDLNKPGDLFASIASVYRIEQGPTAYNNPNLRALLQSAGPRGQQLANIRGVGQTDVETLGAVTAALNEGVISLDQILDGGRNTYITNQALYQQAIQYVRGGLFSQDVANLEAGRYNQIPKRF